MLASCTTLNDRLNRLFSRVFRSNSSPSQPARRLRFEALESRLALSGAPVATDIALSDYLSQAPEMGPLLPPAEVAEADAHQLDEASIQAADALAADLAAAASSGPEAMEGEGESVSPTLLTFDIMHVDGGFVRLFGTLSDDDPGMVNVMFGDLFEGTNALSDSLGNFETYVPHPGYGGTVTARGMDGDGNWSNTMTQIL